LYFPIFFVFSHIFPYLLPFCARKARKLAAAIHI
jgi:hypothetical protein